MRKIKPNADGPKIHCLYDELVDPKTLKYHPKNRNKHPKDQIERLAKILEYQGWRYPIKVSKLSGFVTSGHGRIAAAFLKKWNQVPVVFQEYESEDQEYADLQSDNAIASWAELDLAAINLDIPDIGPDFDIDLLGIKDFTIDAADKYADKDADEVPEVKETDIKLGDLFILGNHRLLCGDATKKEDVDRLMDGQKADIVFTDPPYKMAGGGATKPFLRNWTDKVFTDDKNETLFETPDFKVWIPILKTAVKNDSEALIMVNDRNLCALSNELAKDGWKHHNLLIWKKGNLIKHKWYMKGYEAIVYVYRGKSSMNTISDSNIIEVSNKIDEKQHVSQKPIELIDCLLKNHNGTVFEPFAGSGSTLIACEKTNRKCFGSEIDANYCDVIIRRWEKFSGKTAYLIEDAEGKLKNGPVKFADLASMRSIKA